MVLLPLWMHLDMTRINNSRIIVNHNRIKCWVVYGKVEWLNNTYTSGFYSNGFLQCSVILWSKQAHIERDEITSANFIRKDAAIFLHIMSVICTLHFVDKTIPVKWLMNVHERVIRVLYYCVSGEQTKKNRWIKSDSMLNRETWYGVFNAHFPCNLFVLMDKLIHMHSSVHQILKIWLRRKTKTDWVACRQNTPANKCIRN